MSKITLTEEQRSQIATRFLGGETNKTKLAKEFGTSPRTVGRIVAKALAEEAEELSDEVAEDFKVGDLVTGNEINTYHFTCEGAICKVEEVLAVKCAFTGSDIVVSVIQPASPELATSTTFQVRSEEFTKIGSVSEATEEDVEEIEEESAQEIKTVPFSEEEYLISLKDRKVILSVSGLLNVVGIHTDDPIEGVVTSLCDDGCPWISFVYDGDEYSDVFEADPQYCDEGIPQFELIVEETEEEPIQEVAEDVEPTNIHFTITELAVALTVNGDVQVIDTSHPLFSEVRGLILEGKYRAASEKMDIKKAIEHYSGGRLQINKGQVEFDGVTIRNALANKMVDLMSEGDEGFKGFAKFFELVMENPSKKTRERLMDFVAAEDIGLNVDGHIVAFKNVKAGYVPSRSGAWKRDGDAWTYDPNAYYKNEVGDAPEMPRSEVDDIEDNTCSVGLHVCSVSYLKGFWGTSGHCMKVTIHPADVVAIPPDYNNSKARVCKYTVVEEVTDNIQEYLDKVK